MSIQNIILGIYILGCVSFFALAAKSVFHSYHVFANANGKYANLLPFAILLMPSQLNEVGKSHRLQFFKLLPWLIINLIIVICAANNI